MPGTAPEVSQLHVASPPYALVMALTPPGGLIPNWYCGLSHPVDEAVNVMVVPGLCGGEKFDERLADPHAPAVEPRPVPSK